MHELEYKLEKISDKLDKLEKNDLPTFSESLQTVPEYSEGFKQLGLMALGGAIAPVASGIINKYVPVGNLGSILAGGALRFIVKNDTVQQISNGMIIAGFAAFISNLLAGKIGFSENDDTEMAFSENRVGGVNFG